MLKQHRLLVTAVKHYSILWFLQPNVFWWPENSVQSLWRREPSSHHQLVCTKLIENFRRNVGEILLCIYSPHEYIMWVLKDILMTTVNLLQTTWRSYTSMYVDRVDWQSQRWKTEDFPQAAVNSITKKDCYPLPRIDSCLDALQGSGPGFQHWI